MSKEIGVSILCLVYNHEQYLSDTIEGFLSQKTTFPFEIIINEDASTDLSAEIIRRYQNEYPEIIKPIFHEINQYSQGVNINHEFMLPLATGKYVALCDGDDYWTDPYKLQKQYDAMEKNQQCFMCLHRVCDMNVLDQTTDNISYLPKTVLQTGVISSKDFFRILGTGDFFNEVCYFFRTEQYREYQRHYPEFAQLFMKNKTDDAPMLDYFGAMGDVYYIDDCMAVYRRFTSGSWSDGMRKKSLDEQAVFYQNTIEAQNAFEEFTGGRFNSELYPNRQYFKFNYERCKKNYGAMLDPQYDVVWKKQGKNYKKRIQLLAKHPKLFELVFAVYDNMRRKI